MTRGIWPVLLVLTLLFSGGVTATPATPPGAWAEADRTTRRLPPAAFRELPPLVKVELMRRDCTIPQTYPGGRPHNVIRGHFQRPGQTDWAVLCSRNRISAILVFWRGRPAGVTEIARGADANSLQVVASQTIGFSRQITVATPEYIREHQRRYGGPTPPLTHEGINDAFVGKASVVRYWYGGRWYRLQGAD